MPFLFPKSDYVALRAEAYRNASAKVANPHVGLGAITRRDVMEADRWPILAHWEGEHPWTWHDLWSYYRAVHVRRFEVRVRSRGVLCGLGIGRPSKRKTQLGLDFIQGNPDRNHPLKGQVTSLVLLTAYEYARLIGAIDLRIYNPDPNLVRFYSEAFKYRFVNKAVGSRASSYLTISLKEVP